MMTSSNDDKSDICQFFYQDLFHHVSIQYMCKVSRNVVYIGTYYRFKSYLVSQHLIRSNVTGKVRIRGRLV